MVAASRRGSVLRTHRKQLIGCRCALASFHDNSRWKDVEAPTGSDVAARVPSEREDVALMARVEPLELGAKSVSWLAELPPCRDFTKPVRKPGYPAARALYLNLRFRKTARLPCDIPRTGRIHLLVGPGEQLRYKCLREEGSRSVVTAMNTLPFDVEATFDSVFEHAGRKVLKGRHAQSPRVRLRGHSHYVPGKRR